MKTTRLLLIFLAVIIVLPFFGRFFWILQKGRDMEIMIINKTVPKNSSNEVKSLNWVLNYNKILKTDHSRYRYERDYYGYHPDAPEEEWKIRSYSLAELPSIQEKYNALFFLDNQGVKLTGDIVKTASDYYGGFNQNDYLLLKQMLNADKLIIAEYNFFSNPTVDLVRYNTEQMLDIHSLGWRGKFFNNLNARKISFELDPGWIDRYKDYYGKNWDFQGPGIVIINEKQNRIIVLPRSETMIKDYPEVLTGEKYTGLFHIPEKSAFTGWFSIVYQGHNDIISTFDLNLNDNGKEILMKNGLECRFPAVIKYADHPFYYLAGDFSKEKVMLVWSRIRILNNLIRSVTGNMTNDPGVFFQTYYVPFMSAVLNEQFDEMKEAGI